MSKTMKFTALKVIFLALVAVMVVGMAGTNALAAGKTITWVTDDTSPSPTQVRIQAFYKGTDDYMLTEDTYNKAVPQDLLINSANLGYLGSPIFNFSAQGANWPDLTLANGDAYKVWITNAALNHAADASSVYNSTSDNTANLPPGAGSSGTVRLSLIAGNFLATPAWGATAGNGSVMITWETVSGADSYVIYKRTASSPKGSNNWIAYGKLYTAAAAGDYADTAVTNGTNYYYLIIAKAGTTKMSGHSDEMQLQPSGSVPPKITSVSPVSGNNAAPTTVTIRGAGLTGATLVSVEGASSNNCSITSNTDNQIVVTVPSGITPTGAYNIVVTTGNGVSPIGASTAFTVTAPTTPPNAPTNFTMTGKDTTSISYSWTDNAGNELNYALFNGSDVQVSTLYPENTVSTTERNLLPNTSYTRKAGAINIYGAGLSSPLTTYTNAIAPTNLTAIAASSSQIDLAWTASAGGGNLPSKYEVQRAPDVSGNPGTWATLSSTVVTNSYPDTTCLANTRYHYQVRAYNGSNDTTNFSNVSAETTPSGPPAAPTLSPSSQGNSTSSIQWQIIDNSNNEDSFAVFNGGTQTSGYILTADKAGTLSIVTTIETSLPGPNALTTRTAKAYNGVFGSASAPLGRYTLAAAPTSLVATPVSTKRVTLSWSGTAPKFSVERSILNSPFTPEGGFTLTSTGLTTQDATLPGVRYYRVKSYNSDNVLNPITSNIEMVSPLNPLPAPDNVTGESPTTTSISWKCRDQASDEFGYKLMNGSVTLCAMAASGGTGSDVVTVEGGLTPCKSYTRSFAVYRQYDDTTLSGSVTRSTLPVTPSTPTGNAKSTSSITFNLLPGTNDTSGLQYVIETSTSPSGPWSALSTGYAGTNALYTHSGLLPATPHSYRVSAKNPEGVTSSVSGTFSDTTVASGADAEPPRFDQIKVNQRAFIESSTLSSSLNTLEVTVTDMPTVGCIGVAVVVTTIDAAQTYKQTVAMTGPFPGDIYSGVWRGTFNFASLPPQSGSSTHTVAIYAKDNNGNSTTKTIIALLTPGVQLVDVPLNYPNPFYPNSSTSSYRTTMIQYKLTDDAAIVIEIYNTVGERVRAWEFSKGETGHSKAGVNSVSWDGYSGGRVVGNGMYIYKIFTRSGGKLVNIGTGKLVIWPR